MRLKSLARLLPAGAVTALKYPATVELDLVFPRNDTYNNLTSFPVVLAAQNAEAAFDWGYTFSWDIRGPGSNNLAATGTVYQGGDNPAPPDSVDNVWIVSDTAVNATVLRAGTYRFEWEWSSTSCLESGNRIIIQSGVSASGKMHFSIVTDGSGASFTQAALTGECPVYQDRFTSGRSTDAGCPIRTAKEPDNEPEPCRARLDDTMAACIVANLTGEGDGSACAKLQAGGGNGADKNNMGSRQISWGILALGGAAFAAGLYIL
jgi:hypothetical protein